MLQIDRKEIHEKLLMESRFKQGIVCHNDFDGIISALYFNHKYGLGLKGIFELNSQSNMYSKLYLENRNPKEYIFLDCAISNKNIISIDHHVMPVQAYIENCINANKYNPNSRDVLIYGSFLNKMPMGNVLWIMYLAGEDISKYNYKQQLLLLMADNFHEVYHHSSFSTNAKNWLKYFEMEALEDTLNSPTLVEDIEGLKQEIGIVGVGYQIHQNNNYISHKAGTTTQEVINRICEIMEWEQVELPVFFYAHYFKNLKYPIWKADSILNDYKNVTCAIRTINRGKDSDMYVSEFFKVEELWKGVKRK